MAIPVPEALKPRGSVASAPARRAGSVRRTVTMDFTWPDGMAGDTVLDGRARDLRTGDDGTATVLAAASLRMVTDPRRVIKEVSSAPGVGGLASLAGESAMSGFRRRLAATGAAAAAAGTPLYQLLDDVPGATLVSGAAWQRWYDMDRYLEIKADVAQRVMTDVCTGYQQGSSALQPDGTLRWRQDRQPAVDIDAAGDALAWHPHATPRRGGHAARPPDRRVAGRPGHRCRRVLPGLLDAARGRADRDPRVHPDRGGRPGNGDRARGDPGAAGAALRRVPAGRRPRHRPGRAAAERAAGDGARAVARAARLHPPQRHAPGARRRAGPRPAVRGFVTRRTCLNPTGARVSSAERFTGFPLDRNSIGASRPLAHSLPARCLQRTPAGVAFNPPYPP